MSVILRFEWDQTDALDDRARLSEEADRGFHKAHAQASPIEGNARFPPAVFGRAPEHDRASGECVPRPCG
jgi:hypothetical protein